MGGHCRTPRETCLCLSHRRVLNGTLNRAPQLGWRADLLKCVIPASQAPCHGAPFSGTLERFRSQLSPPQRTAGPELQLTSCVDSRCHFRWLESAPGAQSFARCTHADCRAQVAFSVSSPKRQQPRINVQSYFVVSTNIDGQNFTIFLVCMGVSQEPHSVLSPCTSSSLFSSHSCWPPTAPDLAGLEFLVQHNRRGWARASRRVGVLQPVSEMSSHITHSPGEGRTDPGRGRRAASGGRSVLAEAGVLRIIASLTPG